MSDELSQRARRPLALVVSVPEDRSVQVCRSLVEDGFDALRFMDVESAEAWLDEETPVVAIIGEAADSAWDGVIATLEDRGLAAISIG